MKIHIFDHPGLTVKKEREGKLCENLGCYQQNGWTSKGTRTQNPHILNQEAIYPVATQCMSKMHKKADRYGNYLSLHYARSEILKPILGHTLICLLAENLIRLIALISVLYSTIEAKLNIKTENREKQLSWLYPKGI